MRCSVTAIISFIAFTLSSADREKRLFYGQRVYPGQYPFFVRISAHFQMNGYDEVSLCGGTLLTERVVLTAGHCVYDVNAKKYASFINVTVNDFLWGVNEAGEFNVISSDYDVGMDFLKKGSATEDFSLIYLPKVLRICEKGSPFVVVPLYARGARYTTFRRFLSWRCFTIGFGMTQDGFPASTAQRMDLNNMVLNRWDGKMLLISHLDKNRLQRPCFGDSGGPIMCASGRTVAQVGISSELVLSKQKRLPDDASKSAVCLHSSYLFITDIEENLMDIKKLLRRRGMADKLLEGQRKCERAFKEILVA